MEKKTFIGKGQVYLAEVTSGVAGALLPVGNCSKLALGISDESKDLIDYTSAGGGVYDSIYRIKEVNIDATFHDFTAENLEMALRGESTEVTAGTVTDEVRTAYKGALVPFAYLPDTAQTITVKNSAGDTTYVKDTDYTVKGAGILILSAGAITNAQSIKVSYTKDAAYLIQALTQTGKTYKLFFDGLNETTSGEVVGVEIYTIKFSPIASLEFIGDDFNKLDVKGKVIADTTITGTGISQYFRISRTK